MAKGYEIEICGDCLQASANDLDSFEHSSRFAKAFEEAGGDGGVLLPEHKHTVKACGRAVVNGEADCAFDEGSFSWSPCDWCGTDLGGYRYPAVVFYPTKAKPSA